MQTPCRIALCSLIAILFRGQTLRPQGHLLVLSKGNHTLSVVDVDQKKVLASVPSGPDPHEVVGSTDGRMAYISNYGGGAYNTLTPVDLVNYISQDAIDLGALKGPHGLVYSGGKVWFTAEAAKAVGRYDPATQRVDWILGTGQDRTHMLYVTKDEKQVYTTNVNAATVSFLEQKMVAPGPGPGGPPPGGRRPNGPEGQGQRGAVPGGPPPGGQVQGGPPPGPRLAWEETVVKVGGGDEGFDVSPDGRELWTANAWDGTISVIDIASKRVVQTLTADVPGANRLKFTLDGRSVLVSTLGGGNVTVLDAAKRKVIKRIPVGTGAAGIEMEPGGKHAYVACTPDDYVAVIDLPSMTVSGHIDAGKGPDGMAWVSR